MTAVTRRRWTEEETLKLMELAEAGKSVNLIARKLNRTADAVYKRGHDLGYSMTRGKRQGRPTFWTKERNKTLIDLHRAGLSIAKIAAHMNTTISAIHTQTTELRRQGVNLPHRNQPAQFKTPTLVEKKPTPQVIAEEPVNNHSWFKRAIAKMIGAELR